MLMKLSDLVFVMRYKADLETYDQVMTCLQLSLTDEKAVAAMKDVEEAYVDMTPSGIQLTGIADAMRDAILRFLPEFMEKTTYGEYRIKISNLKITRETYPQPY